MPMAGSDWSRRTELVLPDHDQAKAFHDHEWDPHWHGQVHPSALGALLALVSSDDLELHQVRMYRGMPSNDKDPRGYNAAQRQVLA